MSSGAVRPVGVASLVALSLTLMLVSSNSEAQEPRKPIRIGVLTLGFAPSTRPIKAFRQGLREHGYVEGRNIALEFRFADGRTDRLAALATELIGLKVDIVVTESNVAALAAKRATQTIPIVMAVAGDPLKAGVVASLARPGGNITGLTLIHPEVSGKRLALLKEAVPKIGLVAVMWNPTNPAALEFLRQTEEASRSVGVQLQAIEVRNPGELTGAFDAVTTARPSALISLGDGMLWSVRTRIVDFALKNRLPGVFPERDFPEAGGLMSYGPDVAANFQRAAVFVDKILKGAKPGDLPIEQPTKFELVINLKTAKALGLAIPPSLLLRADQVIE
jgi:putative ABC transport system substrate-binding protein